MINFPRIKAALKDWKPEDSCARRLTGKSAGGRVVCCAMGRLMLWQDLSGIDMLFDAAYGFGGGGNPIFRSLEGQVFIHHLIDVNNRSENAAERVSRVHRYVQLCEDGVCAEGARDVVMGDYDLAVPPRVEYASVIDRLLSECIPDGHQRAHTAPDPAGPRAELVAVTG